MELKRYRLKTEYYDKVVIPYVRRYRVNDVLAIELVEDETYESFSVITVNIPNTISAGNTSFVDTNNCPWVEKFIKENNLGHKTGIYGYSGMCSYPEYEFDISKLNEMEWRNWLITLMKKMY